MSSASSEPMDADPNPTKSARVTIRGAGSPIVCSLPPTCAARPTPLASSADMEAHYAKYHAHVCEVDGCGLVFPDERLLDLVRRQRSAGPSATDLTLQHFTECHDSLAATRQARGDKIVRTPPLISTCTHTTSVRMLRPHLPPPLRAPQGPAPAPHRRTRVPQGVLLRGYEQGCGRAVEEVGGGG